MTVVSQDVMIVRTVYTFIIISCLSVPVAFSQVPWAALELNYHDYLYGETVRVSGFLQFSILPIVLKKSIIKVFLNIFTNPAFLFYLLSHLNFKALFCLL